MLVATFGPTTGWAGREIIWDETRFVLVGHGTISAAGLFDYDRRGQLQWPSAEVRTWALSVAHWETSGTVPSRTSAAPTGGTPGRRGFPAWAVVLIVAGVGVLVVGILMAILIPAFVLRTGESIANETAVGSGVRNIQMGIEAWAAEHGGVYPDAAGVNGSDLSRYIGTWPMNPYTDLPMTRGTSPGCYDYQVSPDGGSFRLVGYGDDGRVVLELGGGGATTY